MRETRERVASTQNVLTTVIYTILIEEQNNTYIDPLYVPETLKEAKKSDEWEQWDKAVKLELDQLEKTGT